MSGLLKTIFLVVLGFGLFTLAFSMIGSAWPTWVLIVLGFFGGNTIVALSTLVFIKEWFGPEEYATVPETR